MKIIQYKQSIFFFTITLMLGYIIFMYRKNKRFVDLLDLLVFSNKCIYVYIVVFKS